MLDVWTMEPGDKVERMPDGKVGTFVDWEQLWNRLTCGCCDEQGPAVVELMWDDGTEGFEEAEDLRPFTEGA